MGKLFCCIFLLTVLLSSCEYENKEVLLGDVCDTVNVSYTSTVAPLIAGNCVVCHGPNLQEAGIRVDSHSELLKIASSGALVKVINHEAGVTAMPYNLSKLSNCEISTISAWVNQGALNN